MTATGVRAPLRVFVARHGRHQLTNLHRTWAQLDELVERMRKSRCPRIDPSGSFVDA